MSKTQPRILADRLALLDTINLDHGSHRSFADGHCAMEVAAWLAGRKHSDEPRCVAPTIRGLMVAWNDRLQEPDRTRLLRPLLRDVLGTADGDEVELRRSYLVLDWYCRTFTPAWLDLVPSLVDHAAAIRALPEITKVTATDVLPVLKSARTASDAAWAAAWDAGRAAAWAAAGDAAWDAAGDAGRAAAWAAAGDALRPTVEALQISMQDLVRRMAALHRVEPVLVIADASGLPAEL